MGLAESIQIGQRLGPYRIEGLLGAGGMGCVYLAVDVELQRTVAIKVPKGTQQTHDALWQEARLAAALNHPAICTVHEIGQADNVPFLVMEHVKGTLLSALLRTRGRLPPEVTMSYALQVADAVEHAHERGVVHGDIKSSNVMVATTGQVKVLDFGVSVRCTEKPDDSDAETTSPPPSGGPTGTVSYMAPELFRGRVPDVHSDIWALGVLLYEMLTGRRPFRGNTPYETAAHILCNQRITASRVPRALLRVIDRCLCATPVDRYASARDFASALDDLHWMAGTMEKAKRRPSNRRLRSLSRRR